MLTQTSATRRFHHYWSLIYLTLTPSLKITHKLFLLILILNLYFSSIILKLTYNLRIISTVEATIAEFIKVVCVRINKSCVVCCHIISQVFHHLVLLVLLVHFLNFHMGLIVIVYYKIDNVGIWSFHNSTCWHNCSLMHNRSSFNHLRWYPSWS